MLVKCDLCGKMIEKSTAYRTETTVNKRDGTIGSKKIKACSESEWLHKLKLDADKKEMWELVQKYLGETNNTVLFKEEKLWGSPDKVVRFIKENETLFNIMDNKIFNTECHKIRYFSAIIKNNINDMPDEVVPEVSNETNDTIELEVYENKHKNIRKRRCLTDYE